jgi:hypothetical protein
MSDLILHWIFGKKMHWKNDRWSQQNFNKVKAFNTIQIHNLIFNMENVREKGAENFP